VQAELTIETGRNAGQRYVIRLAQKFVLGRGHDVSIHLEDDRVSRRHAQVELRAEGVFVTDLGSRNGTYMEGERLPPRQARLLDAGARVELGAHRLRLEITGVDPRTRKERARTQRLDEPVLPREEFEILGEIGRGATGRVYAADQRLLGRTVAIKVLRNEIDVDEEGRERFLREGKLACRIESPYIIEVYDIRLAYGRVYLVMELVNGASVKDRLSGGALAIPEALRIGEDVSNALVAAHRVGVIHRDIKPANILLSPKGIAKLGDFGIAKDLEALESLTATGEGLGTLAYVSPEQATEAKTVDHRTDLYSLGATLYHMLAGRPPFLPRNARVLLDILDKPPPQLRELRPDCPPEVAAFVHKMLEKDPTRRPKAASEVAQRLFQLRSEHYPKYKHWGDLSDTELGESQEFFPPET
jgi:serine/threonine protein kinase